VNNISSIIYLDTSVWLSFLRKDSNYLKSKEIIENASQRDNVIFYSSLILLEIIDVIRRKYPDSFTYEGRNSKIQMDIES
jgi:predicted nucleic acid-binding protein